MVIRLWSGIPYAVVFAWFAFVNHQSDWWVCHQSDMWHVVGDLENDQRFRCTGSPQNSEFPWSQKIAVLFCTHAEDSLQWIQLVSHLRHLSRLITSLGLFLCHLDQCNLFLSASPCQIWKARKLFLQCFVIWQTCWSYQNGCEYKLVLACHKTLRMSLVVSMAAWGDRFADTRSWLFRIIEEIVKRSTL